MKAVGAGSWLTTSIGALAHAVRTSDAEVVKPEPVPQRPFGKTGVMVPILSFGGSLDIQPLMLRQAMQWGVRYWDTAASYMGGNSETRIGKYLAKYPEDRKKIFLVTKSHARAAGGLSEDLDGSLARMKTDYVDLFCKHAVRKPQDLDDDLKVWAEKAKAGGKIRLFGFSTHSNMEECMLKAATLGWIDGIMMKYNYRLMHTDRM
ncbi:MAG: aldo/keto reductase, partial [Desulfobacterales bacterium]